MSLLLSVSESTLYLCMAFHGLKKQEFTIISNYELNQEVFNFTQQYPFCGKGMNGKTLSGRGIKVQRFRLRQSLHRIDEVRITERSRGRLHRRVYNVQGASQLWHIDTNHKLVRWHIVIFGGIDGFSRLPVVLA